MIMRIVRTMKCVVNAMGKITNSKLTYKLRLQDSTSKLLFCLVFVLKSPQVFELLQHPLLLLALLQRTVNMVAISVRMMKNAHSMVGNCKFALIIIFLDM